MEDAVNIEGLRLTEDEGPRLEYKRASKSILPSVWETLSAFANTDGGTIVLGVSEEGDANIVTGVEDPVGMRQEIMNTVSNPQKVSYRILKDSDVTIRTVEGRSIIVINVPRMPRHQSPLFINGDPMKGTYIRRGEGDYLCNLNEVASLMRGRAEYPMDMEPLDGYGIADIDPGSLRECRAMIRARSPRSEFNSLDDEEFLLRTGCMADLDGERVLTDAGLLLFGKEWRIYGIFPWYRLDYAECASDDGFEWSFRIVTGDATWNGNVFGFYRRVVPRILEDYGGDSSLDGAYTRTDISEIGKALREAVVNGLVHADYSSRMGLRILKRPRSIEIDNPGVFRIPIGMAEEGGFSDARNPVIMRMFRLLGESEEMGMGVHRIMRAWLERGLVKPVYTESMDPPRTSLELRLTGPSKDSSAESVLELIRADPKISVVVMADRLGVAPSTVYSRIDELRSSGRLARIGGKRNGEWRVLRRSAGQCFS